jgi:hypothetical protein
VKKCTAREKLFYNGPSRAAKTGEKTFVPQHDEPNEPSKQGLLGTPFASVSKVSRGYPSLVSLITTGTHVMHCHKTYQYAVLLNSYLFRLVGWFARGLEGGLVGLNGGPGVPHLLQQGLKTATE